MHVAQNTPEHSRTLLYVCLNQVIHVVGQSAVVLYIHSNTNLLCKGLCSEVAPTTRTLAEAQHDDNWSNLKMQVIRIAKEVVLSSVDAR